MNNCTLLALAGVAQWIECWPVNQNVTGRFPVRAQAWVVGHVPSWGHMRGNRLVYLFHFDDFLLLFLLPFPSL